MTIETQAPILAQLFAIKDNPAISLQGRLNAAEEIIAYQALEKAEALKNVSPGFMRYPPLKPGAEPRKPCEAIVIPGELQAP